MNKYSIEPKTFITQIMYTLPLTLDIGDIDDQISTLLCMVIQWQINL